MKGESSCLVWGEDSDNSDLEAASILGPDTESSVRHYLEWAAFNLSGVFKADECTFQASVAINNFFLESESGDQWRGEAGGARGSRDHDNVPGDQGREGQRGERGAALARGRRGWGGCRWRGARAGARAACRAGTS